jgi:hypothetical protein
MTSERSWGNTVGQSLAAMARNNIRQLDKTIIKLLHVHSAASVHPRIRADFLASVGSPLPTGARIKLSHPGLP